MAKPASVRGVSCPLESCKAEAGQSCFNEVTGQFNLNKHHSARVFEYFDKVKTASDEAWAELAVASFEDRRDAWVAKNSESDTVAADSYEWVL